MEHYLHEGINKVQQKSPPAWPQKAYQSVITFPVGGGGYRGPILRGVTPLFIPAGNPVQSGSTSVQCRGIPQAGPVTGLALPPPPSVDRHLWKHNLPISLFCWQCYTTRGEQTLFPISPNSFFTLIITIINGWFRLFAPTFWECGGDLQIPFTILWM